ncbi:MAG: hypothetical protein A2017_18050 [Lentisphaerae bacterium GWF2_44_16]|nr:MAG: hypothetical protein A2017_18050 [Lentisphaerae bacterium GWF2_44_16]
MGKKADMKVNYRHIVFTLTELLFVIAIIIVLFSLLLPALSRVKDKAHVIQCTNNEKQIYYGILAYSQNYNYLPVYCTNPSSAKTYNSWFELSEIKPSLMKCPSDKDFAYCTTNYSSYHYVSYGYNVKIGTGPSTYYRIEQAEHPSKIITASDSDGRISDGKWGSIIDPTDTYALSTRHSLRPVTLFLDGHVKQHLKFELLSSDWWNIQ